MTDPLVLAFDASWGGTGWCLSSPKGPYLVGHFKGGAKSSPRYDRLYRELEKVRAEIAPIAAAHAVRVVVEDAPEVYSRGNQAATGYGLGCMAGALQLWAATLHRQAPTAWLYPWPVPVKEWRGWWNMRIKGRRSREKWKIAAMLTCERHGFGPHIRPYGWRNNLGLDQQRALVEKPCADVAEAILLSVGAAMRPEMAKKGPRIR